MEQEQLERIITTLVHDQSVIQLVHNRVLEINQGRNAIDIQSLAMSIRQSSPRVYSNLTDTMLTQIINEIQEYYGDVTNITLDDWNNDEVLQRLVDLHNYVRNRLAKLLHKENRQIGWGIVGKIIKAVFGSVPVITKGVREVLHNIGFLSCQFTQCIQTLLEAVRNFWNRNRDLIIECTSEIIIRGAFELGRGYTPLAVAIKLAPDILSILFLVCHREIRYWQNRNQEHND